MHTRAFLHPSDAHIVHTDGATELYDAEYDLVYTFPGKWELSLVLEALQLANRFYGYGFNAGDGYRASEVRKAIGLAE